MRRVVGALAVFAGLYGCSALADFSALTGPESAANADGGNANGGDADGSVTEPVDAGGDAGSNGTGDDAGQAADGGGGADAAAIDAGIDATVPHAVKTVFLITMTHLSQAGLKSTSSAPYLTNLAKSAATATNYSVAVPAIGYAEPHVLWFEAGDNLGIVDDGDPSANHQATTSHFVDELESAGVAWKSYQEDIDGTTCPLADTGSYIVHHNPFVFFDDVTMVNSPSAARCIAHVRPYTDLATDLSSGKVARYNYIVPNVCHDMHDDCNVVDGGTPDPIAPGDKWLSSEVPKIMASNAYKNGGVIMIVWDYTSTAATTTPFFVVSSLAKPGYAGAVAYSHSSLLKSLSEIFGVAPIRGAAAPGTNDLADLFTTFP
jgi:hypothetical protein